MAGREGFFNWKEKKEEENPVGGEESTGTAILTTVDELMGIGDTSQSILFGVYSPVHTRHKYRRHSRRGKMDGMIVDTVG